jgi:hypothetical protein
MIDGWLPTYMHSQGFSGWYISRGIKRLFGSHGMFIDCQFWMNAEGNPKRFESEEEANEFLKEGQHRN